jgi:Zn-dependent M28 family amino/carboxypeptidase
MKNIFLIVLLIACNHLSLAQNIDAIINAKEVESIERVLAADNMQGRKAGTPSNEKAAQFIADEFKKVGLQTWNSSNSYLQPFKMVEPSLIEIKAEIDDKQFDPKKVIVLTSQKEIKINEKSGLEIFTINAGASVLMEGFNLFMAGKNGVVFVDESHAANFRRLSQFSRQVIASDKSLVFILTNQQPKTFTIKAEHAVKEIPIFNVVGILPGKSKSNEYVIFSAHYDHLGIGKPINGDSIYNGANDDAAGTTAVIMLAKYFKQLNNNERTLVFAAFTAEEMGGFGSQYFSKQFDPNKVMAMFNIEMIGTESKWGKNSAYMTGFEKTNMGKILQENLKGTAFSFHPDPYPEQDLFYRSDNATLARLGVPAHTISTSKMDSEKYYHTVDDEIETLDMENMAAIIKAIAESSKTIVSGKDTPTRVNTTDLR